MRAVYPSMCGTSRRLSDQTRREGRALYGLAALSALSQTFTGRYRWLARATFRICSESLTT